MKKLNVPVRVVFYRDELDKSTWVAHCLELDLMGYGDDKNSAFEMLSNAVSIATTNAIRSGNFKGFLTPAPSEIQLKYAKGLAISNGELTIQIPSATDDCIKIEKWDCREYRDDAFSDENSECEMAIA
ncbi:MAG: hypothetical protein U0798_02470 [Gemmataceae bacterium]